MGAALLWRSPAARPLKRMPLNRVRWMDCGSDQAGAPGTTPHQDPRWLRLTHARAHGPMHTPPLHSQRRLCTAARWNMAKRRPIILQTDDSGCGRPAHFSCRSFKPRCCRPLTTALFFQSFCLWNQVQLGPDILAAAACALWDYLWKNMMLY